MCKFNFEKKYGIFNIVTGKVISFFSIAKKNKKINARYKNYL